MMKSTLIKNLGLLTLGTFGLMAAGAQADWNRDNHRPNQSHHAYQQSIMFSQQINARQTRQMERIQAGQHEAQITRAEFRALMHEQHKIRAMERHFRADGIIDAREFRRLDHALNLSSHNIRTERHDQEARNRYGHSARFNQASDNAPYSYNVAASLNPNRHSPRSMP